MIWEKMTRIVIGRILSTRRKCVPEKSVATG